MNKQTNKGQEMSQAYEFEGKVINIGDVITIESKNGQFKKCELVILDDDEKYPQEVSFEVSGKTIDAISDVSVGAIVKVKFSLRGRRGTGRFEDRWFTSANAFFIDVIQSGASVPGQQATQEEEEIPF